MAIMIGDLEKNIPKENIKYNEPMSKHTSFKTGGNVDCYIIGNSLDIIKNTLNFAKQNNIDLFIMGNGSNTLVLDNGIRGIVLKIALDNIEIYNTNNSNYINNTNNSNNANNANRTNKQVIVKCGAGVKVMVLAQKLKQNEISGFEELAGIPGTIGGANYMNAGAYGKEMKDVILETKVLNIENGNIEILKKDEQELSYRSSVFKNKKYIILETTLTLQKGRKDKIEEKMQQFLNKRKEKQPLEYPSAGSTFKRENGFITAQLIDECGLKGYSIGGAQISEKHAGFIINKGNATSKDIMDLIEYIKKKVFEKFGVEIEEEVEIIG